VTDLLRDLKNAIETGDAGLWSSLHSADFEQTDLWDSSHPPSNPRKRIREEVADAVGRAVRDGFQFRVTNMVRDGNRLAYTITCISPDGRTVIANNNAETRDGVIVSELMVLAGEPDA
jgi:hypothetical protein